jgi:branched-chain amino acid transport system ATP-binding protein
VRLALRQVTVTIHGITILRGVTLTIEAGRIVGLVGRNGAGKTTTLRTIMGLAPVASGGVALDDEDLTDRPPHVRARLGIGYVPEDRRLIGPLSVRENILVPAWGMSLPDAEDQLVAIYALMPELRELASRRAALLSGGQQKLVALARSFMNGSRIILLDEPFEGVAPPLARRLLQAVRDCQAHRPGLAVLIAESESKWVRLLAGKVYAIERGMTTEAPDRNA